MIHATPWRAPLVMCVLLGVGCGGDDGGTIDAAEQIDAAPADAPPVLDDFPLRAPMPRAIACGAGTMTFADADWFCRIPLPSGSIDLYVQATPTACESSGLTETPVFGQTHGWVKVNGAGDAFAVAAGYQWGGNHHNDSLGFSYDGQTYGLWHSSIGFGFRVCQPVDCLLTCAAGSTVELCNYTDGGAGDGCARASGGPPPPAPVLCAPMNADGTLPALTDPWTAMPPRLPCGGDI